MGKINPFIFNIAETKLYYQNIAKVGRNATKMGLHILGAMPRRIKKRCRADILWRLTWQRSSYQKKETGFYRPKEDFSLNAASSFIFAA